MIAGTVERNGPAVLVLLNAVDPLLLAVRDVALGKDPYSPEVRDLVTWARTGAETYLRDYPLPAPKSAPKGRKRKEPSGSD